jgi:hypothetical protein
MRNLARELAKASSTCDAFSASQNGAVFFSNAENTGVKVHAHVRDIWVAFHQPGSLH